MLALCARSWCVAADRDQPIRGVAAFGSGSEKLSECHGWGGRLALRARRYWPYGGGVLDARSKAGGPAGAWERILIEPGRVLSDHPEQACQPHS